MDNVHHGKLVKELLRDGIYRLSENPGREPTNFTRPEPESGAVTPLSVEEKDGLLLVKVDGKTVLEEIPFKEDPRRFYIKDEIIDREQGEQSSGEGSGVKLDDRFSYEKVITFEYSGEHGFYGLGDHVGPLSREGYEFVNYNTDDPSEHTEDKKSLYKSFPLLLISLEKGFLAIYLDNSYRSLFDCGVEPGKLVIAAKKGDMDIYMAYGQDYAEILRLMSSFLGRPSLPPVWAFMPQQSRWGYSRGEKDVRTVVEGYKDKDIPLGVVNLDIDYMDGYRVFTFDKNRWPNPEKAMRELPVKLITIVDPGVKKEDGYPIYDEMIKKGLVATRNGETYVNEVWPGEAVYPAFNKPECAKKWAEYVGGLLDMGVSGIWNDMNEPASFKGQLPDGVDFAGIKHDEMHNLYGYYMGEATAKAFRKRNKRPFIITRAAFMGSQTSTVCWTGDNHSTYNSLSLLPAQLLNLGMSLMPFAGSDIGGFSGDCPEHLMRKWVAFGTVNPLFRNHSAINTKKQEPYHFGKRTVDAYRTAARLRMRLIPLFYALAHEAETTGLPYLRPLFAYSDDPKAKDIDDQLFLGDSIMVAPILKAGPDVRMVYFPKGLGRYYSFHDGSVHEGGTYEIVEAEDGKAPMYVKEGAIIPLLESENIEDVNDISKLVFKAYPGNGECLVYLDDGESLDYQAGKSTIVRVVSNDGEFSASKAMDGYVDVKEITVETLDGKRHKVKVD